MNVKHFVEPVPYVFSNIEHEIAMTANSSSGQAPRMLMVNAGRQHIGERPMFYGRAGAVTLVEWMREVGARVVEPETTYGVWRRP